MVLQLFFLFPLLQEQPSVVSANELPSMRDNWVALFKNFLVNGLVQTLLHEEEEDSGVVMVYSWCHVSVVCAANF